MKAVSQFGAVGLALTGFTLWVLADASLKIVGASRLPTCEVVAGVGLAMCGWMAVHCAWRGELKALWPRQPGRQMLRSLLDLTNFFCVIIALRHLPLALFYILVFSSPLVTTLLAAATLGERLEWKRGLALAAGFAGVVIAVNPLGVARAGDWTGYLACLVCVACFSSSLVWSRVMAQTESPESLTFFSGLVMAAVGSCAPVFWVQPVTSRLAAVLGATGLFCVVGSLCFFVALRHATAAMVSQYHYSQLLTGALLAYVIWHERLTRSMVVGAALIIGAGVYTAMRSYASAPARGAGSFPGVIAASETDSLRE